jgi:hypothetical protein
MERQAEQTALVELLAKIDDVRSGALRSRLRSLDGGALSSSRFTSPMQIARAGTERGRAQRRPHHCSG